MKVLRSVLVCSMIAGLVPLSTVGKDKTEEMVAAAKALDEAFVKAYNAKDADAAAELYWKSEDVVSFMPFSMEIRGWEAVKENFSQEFEKDPFTKLELIESHYIVAGDYVTTWGIWKATAPGPDGKPVVMEGRYSDLKFNDGEKWVYVLDHASMPMPVMEE